MGQIERNKLSDTFGLFVCLVKYESANIEGTGTFEGISSSLYIIHNLCDNRGA